MGDDANRQPRVAIGTSVLVAWFPSGAALPARVPSHWPEVRLVDCDLQSQAAPL
jgi:hypothetical protein